MKFRYRFMSLLTGLFLFTSCNESTIDEPLFEYTQNYTGSVQVPLNIDNLTIENSIGFIFLNGSADTLAASYVLNKKVKVTESSLAQNEFNKILFNNVAVSDTLNWKIDFPSSPIDRYRCSLNLNIPAGKKIIVKKNNSGVQTYALENDIYVETDNDGCVLEGHGGSAEIHTLTGNITAMISIPDSGYCKCYSSDGNITVQVPIGSSANIILKTTSGTITHSNLNIQNLAGTNKELTGTIGAGNGTIYVETVKGNILLEGF
jgi:hypothetical protein